MYDGGCGVYGGFVWPDDTNLTRCGGGGDNTSSTALTLVDRLQQAGVADPGDAGSYVPLLPKNIAFVSFDPKGNMQITVVDAGGQGYDITSPTLQVVNDDQIDFAADINGFPVSGSITPDGEKILLNAEFEPLPFYKMSPFRIYFQLVDRKTLPSLLPTATDSISTTDSQTTTSNDTSSTTRSRNTVTFRPLVVQVCGCHGGTKACSAGNCKDQTPCGGIAGTCSFRESGSSGLWGPEGLGLLIMAGMVFFEVRKCR